MKVDIDAFNLALAKSCMTKRELAEQSNVDPVTITRIITERQKPRPKTIGKIAKALNVTIEELLKK